MSLRYLKYQLPLFYPYHDNKPRQMSEYPAINVANDPISLVLGKISIKYLFDVFDWLNLPGLACKLALLERTRPLGQSKT